MLDRCCNSLGDKFKEAFILRAEKMVERVLTSEKEKTDSSSAYQKKFRDRLNQIVSFYYKVIEELLIIEEKKGKNGNVMDLLIKDTHHKAMIACCLEIGFFVNNTSNINFEKLLELCDIQSFEFWEIISTFVKFDQQIPYPIKKHLHEIEIKILTYLAWKKDSMVHQMIKNIAEESFISKYLIIPNI